MSRIPHLTRRQFLGRTAALSCLPTVLSSRSWGAESRPSPSRRITLGFIGVGGMGGGHLGGLLGRSEVQILAVCDVDRSRRESARDRVESGYADATRSGTYSGCAAYSDFRDLVARDDIEAVVIATPDHWHALPVIAAAKAGKDIYCEKPFSLTISEGRAMVEAVRRHQRVYQVGSQQRSDRNFRFACELARNGRLGQLHTIRTSFGAAPSTTLQQEQPIPDGFDYDFWLGQAPWAPYTEQRCHSNFRWILDYSGGMMTDWGAHHNDIAQWGNGTDRSGPIQIKGRGKFPAEGLWNVPTEFQVEYVYANGVKVLCSNEPPHGVRFEGSEGWVHVDRGSIRANPNSLLSSTIGPDEIHLYESDNHHQNFLDCIRSRAETIAPAEVGHRSVTVCHLGNIAMLLERTLKWNPDREQFVDDPEADRMLSRPMRSPWTL